MYVLEREVVKKRVYYSVSLNKKRRPFVDRKGSLQYKKGFLGVSPKMEGEGSSQNPPPKDIHL